jgi:hypothetical protein
MHAQTSIGQVFRKRSARFLIEVDDADRRAIAPIALDERLADAAAAARDQNHTVVVPHVIGLPLSA